jgi:hypothetical protein
MDTHNYQGAPLSQLTVLNNPHAKKNKEGTIPVHTQDTPTSALPNLDKLLVQTQLTDDDPWSNVQTKKSSPLKNTHNTSPTRIFNQFTPLSECDSPETIQGSIITESHNKNSTNTANNTHLRTNSISFPFTSTSSIDSSQHDLEALENQQQPMLSLKVFIPSAQKTDSDNTVTFLDQPVLPRTKHINTGRHISPRSRQSKAPHSTPNKSSLSTKTITNIGKPITRFKAHSYQVYICITKQGKDKLINANIIAHTFLKAL